MWSQTKHIFRTEGRQRYWFVRLWTFDCATVWALHSWQVRNNAMGMLQKYIFQRIMFWGLVFHSACRYRKSQHGVSLQAPLSGVAGTGINWITDMIACRGRIREEVSRMSSLVVLPSENFWEKCRRHWERFWQRPVVNRGWDLSIKPCQSRLFKHNFLATVLVNQLCTFWYYFQAPFFGYFSETFSAFLKLFFSTTLHWIFLMKFIHMWSATCLFTARQMQESLGIRTKTVDEFRFFTARPS